MRIERISASAFRGYPDRMDVTLGGDVILIYGENGTGKTSLTEAFEWALFGTIVRKARSKTPGEYQGKSWIRSAHASEDAKTFAEVELRSPSGDIHVVRRELAGSTETLYVDGKVTSDVTVLGISVQDAFRPFLGQCEIQGLIDSEQQDRWEQLSSILGFGAFGRARARMQRIRTDTDHDQRVQQIRDVASRVVQPLTPPGENPLDTDPDQLRKRAAKFLALADDAPWADVDQAATSAINALFKGGRRPTALDELLAGPKDLDDPLAGLEHVAEEFLGQANAHREWHEQNTRSSFATSGLRLVDDESEVCPFCAASTLTRQRVETLQRLAEFSGPRPTDHRSRFEDQVRLLSSAGPANPKALDGLREALPEGAEKGQLEAVAIEQSDLQQQKQKLEGLAEGAVAAVEVASRIGANSTAVESLIAQLIDLARDLAGRYKAARVSVEQLEGVVAKRYASLSDADQERLSGLQKAKILAENAGAVESAWRIKNLQAELAEVVTKLEAAEKLSMEQALETLSTDADRYYERMSPGNHIKKIGIRVRQNSKRRQATLKAKSHEKDVNPVTTFSEAEGNCLGLSLYFSQRVDRNPAWSVIMLDDPVQSMDKGHEQGLIGVLADISADHQIIVLTHAKSFEEYFAQQFRPIDSFQHYRTLRSDGPMPEFEVAEGRFEDLVAYAEQNRTGPVVRRESAAGAIRKAVERLSRDIALKHGEQLKRGAKPSELVQSLSRFGVEDIDRGTLNRIVRFGTRGAHDDLDVNPVETAIFSNAQQLRDLHKKYIGTPAGGTVKAVAVAD